MEPTFSFRPLSPADFDLLTTWHAEPHIIEAYGEERSIEKVTSRYTVKLSDPAIEMFIVIENGRDIGFIQAYNAPEVGHGWWPDEPKGTWGVDVFIGEPDCLDRGKGPVLIKEFSDALLARPGVQKVISDPDPKNKRSIGAFKKAGFLEVKPITTPDGDALLMEKLPG